MGASIRFYRDPWVWGLHVFGVLIALLVPEDQLSRSIFLKTYVDFMSELFPPIAGYARRSPWPQVSALYFSVMFPLGTIWLWRGLRSPVDTFINLSSKFWTRPRWIQILVWVVLGFPICIGIAYFMIRINPGYDMNILSVHGSRLGLGLFGVAYTLLPWLLIATYFHLLRFILKRT